MRARAKILQPVWYLSDCKSELAHCQDSLMACPSETDSVVLGLFCCTAEDCSPQDEASETGVKP